MPSDGARLLAAYKAADAIYAAQPGGHATSQPWLATLERFWLSGRRRLALRCGRQSGKSTTLARVAVATALWGQHRIAAGTRGSIVFISIKLAEATERLHNIEWCLRALSEPYKRKDDTIELLNRPIVITCIACSFRTAVGMVAIMVVEDEVARWRNENNTQNPAHEVDAAVTPALITQPNGRIYSASSPLGGEDFHAELMDRGETDEQCIAAGPSWFWNPVITEQATHDLQPDLKVWTREFAAIPGAGSSNAFDPDSIAAAFDTPLRRFVPCGDIALAVDAAGVGRDGFAWCSVQWVWPEPEDHELYEIRADFSDPPRGLYCYRRDGAGRRIRKSVEIATPRVLHFADFDGADASYRARTSADEVYKSVSDAGRRIGATVAYMDKFEAFSGGALLKRGGITAKHFSWAAGAKQAAVLRLRAYLNAGLVRFAPGPHADQLRRELLSFQERINGNGVSYGAGRDSSGQHWDFTSCLMSACMADASGDLQGAPANNRPSHAFSIEPASSFESAI